MRGMLRSLVVVSAGAGLVAGLTYAPATINLVPDPSPGPVRTAQVEPLAATRSICPGPEVLGIQGLPDSRSQSVSVTAVAAPMASLPSRFAPAPGRGSLTISGLPRGGKWPAPLAARGHVVSGAISAARSAVITGAGPIAPGVVGAQRFLARTGDNRGLATVACLPAQGSSWLIAGGAEPGRRERLVLTNPGPNPVTVDLSVLGRERPVEPSDGLPLVVAGYARTVVLLDAAAGTQESPVVHVVAHGGRVAAVLNDTWLDGVIPRGGDDAAPVASPAREQVIAAVPIAGRATLRLAVPGDTEAVVQSRMLTRSGPRPLPAGGVTRVAGHSTKDIDLTGMPPGAYAVQIRGDVPVVAAAVVERRRAPRASSDLAWSGASVPIRTVAGMALNGPAENGPAEHGSAENGSAENGAAENGARESGLVERLDLAATTHPASVLVTTVGAGGVATTNEVAVGADSIASVPLDGATSVWVTPQSGIVRAAVVTGASDAQGELLSVTPLTDLRLTSIALVLKEQQE